MGNNIASERVRLGLTQEQLAEKLSIGKSTLNKHEQDASPMSVNLLSRMSEIFNCSTDYILGLTDERKRVNQ